jgi:parallel beta-helix repeat protein
MIKISSKQVKVTEFVLVILCSLMLVAQSIKVAEANFLPVPVPQPSIVIQEDGSIIPSTVPMEQDDDVYKLMDNIEGFTIVIQRANVIVDGNGFTLKGNSNSTGVFVKNISNVTLQNMQITGFSKAIYLLTDVYMEITGNHKVYSNNITDSHYGIYIQHSTKNVLRNNQLNNTGGILVTYSPLLSDLPSFVNDVDDSNTVNGKPIVYWVNQHNKAVPPNAGQVILVQCTNIEVQNLKLTGNSCSLMLVYTKNSTIVENSITNNSVQGVYIYRSSDNSITENIIENNSYGCYLWYSSNNNIKENIITANNQSGIQVFSSTDNNMKANEITLNNQGVYVDSQSVNNSILDNIIQENNEWGVTVSWSSNNTISKNNIEKNGNGILADNSVNNRITENIVKENIGWGIRLEDGQRNNVIYHNYFIDNNNHEMQVSIPGLWTPDTWDPGNLNLWDDGKKGNYWSEYLSRYPNATEIENTGIGNTPYHINPNNIDNYPIIEDNIIPEFPSGGILVFIVAMVTLGLCYKQRLKNIKNRLH